MEDIARTVLDASYPPGWNQSLLLSRLEEALGRVQDSPLAETLCDRWIRLIRRPGVSWDGRLPVSIAEGSNLHGLARLTLMRARSRWKEERGQFDQELAEAIQGQFVRHALAVGPFGSEGGQFHEVRYPPEYEEPDLSSSYDGRFGKVKYRLIHSQKGSTQLRLAPAYPRERNVGAHYALVQIHAERDLPCYLEVSCNGSHEAWWNGRRVASVNRFVCPSPVRTYSPGVLERGWNRVLFKTTSSNVSTCSLRFLDASGHPVRGTTIEDSEIVHATKLDASGDIPLPGPFITATRWVRSRLKNRSPVLRALLGNLLSRDGFGDEGLHQSRLASAEAPGDTTILAATLECWRLARHVPRDVVRTRERQILDTDGIESHRHLFERKIRRLFQDDRREDALRMCRQRLDQHPDEIPTLALEYDLLRRWKWAAEARSTLERLLVLAPGHPSYTLDMSNLERRSGNLRSALARVETLLADLPGHGGLLTRAFSLARSMGDWKRSESLLSRVHRRDPEGRNALEARASMLSEQGKAEQALRIYQGLLENHDSDAALLRKAGGVALAAGKRQDALALYQRSLALKPEQHDLRHWLWRLRHEKAYPECAPFHMDALALAKEYMAKSDDAASPSTLVLDQMIIRVYPDGSMMEETHQLRRINDRKGVELFEQADRAAGADDLLEIRTIHPDGSTYVPHLVAGTFSMPRLVPGCFIEERYRNFKQSPNANPVDFVRFYFQSLDEPFRFSQLVVLLPKGSDLGEFALRNFPSSDIETREIGKLVAHVITKKDMPRIVKEPMMPAIEELIPWMTFGKDHDLGALVRRQRDWFMGITHPYFEIREKADELCKGLESDAAKSRAIHDFANSHTPDLSQRSGSPMPVSVLLKNEGDRFPLQLALLRAAGIPWTPILIHPRPREMDVDPDPLFNDPRYYNARAALVRPRHAEPFWVIQGAVRYLPFGKLPSRIRGAPLAGCPYLKLTGDTGAPGRMPGTGIDQLTDVSIETQLKLDGDDAEIEAVIHFGSNIGFSLKETIRSQNLSTQRFFARNVSGRFFRGFTVRSSALLGLERNGTPLRLRIVLSRKHFLEKDGDTLLLPPVMRPNSLTRRFGGRSQRTYPLEWLRYFVREWKMTIDPGKHRFHRLPNGLSLRRMILDYGLSYGLENGKLVVLRRTYLIPGK
ncbi:MAG: hypothetical protein ACE5F1_08935, partial [Planctomycetota bacterium]